MGLQATRQRLVREGRNANEALDQAVDERDAAIGQLRRERQFFTAEHRALEMKAQVVAECELNGEHESEMSAVAADSRTIAAEYTGPNPTFNHMLVHGPL